MMSPPTTLATAKETIRYFDAALSIAVGTVAINAHLEEAGVAAQLPCMDVDVLADSNTIERAISAASLRTPVAMVVSRAPKILGGPPTEFIDIIDQTGELLPITFSSEIGYPWQPTLFTECARIAVFASGVRCVPLATSLLWTTRVGRAKDVAHVGAVLKNIAGTKLLATDEYEQIHTEFERVRTLRLQHPHRYYADIESYSAKADDTEAKLLTATR